MVKIKHLDVEPLSEEDFEISPYWMFYAGPKSEYDPFTTLIPESHPDYCADYVRLIKSSYRLNNGHEFQGYVYEDPENLMQHTIFCADSSFCTWYGIKRPTKEDITLIYKIVSMSSDDIFPIKWRSHKNEYSGDIMGFGFLTEEQELRFIK